MKIKFRNIHLSKKNKVRLDMINEIIEDYKKQGYKLTLRQLYYRLVTRNVIANQVKEYDKLSHLLTEGRMAGVVDWDAIEDRIRQPKNVYYNDDVEDAVNDAFKHYRLDRQIGITMQHIKAYTPPPNPAKISDPRANWYISNFGNESWEVDALEPVQLHGIIDEHLNELLDMDKVNELKEQEIVDRAILKQLPAERERIKNIREYVMDNNSSIKKDKSKHLNNIISIVNG